MKTQRNILIAFLLNLFFSIFEFAGGILTGSVAIMSDALHDLGDATSIGISYFLEKKSKRKPDSVYTYGYTRYSVLGSFITTVILLVGSGIVIANAVSRIASPSPIHYDGMILFAVIGVIVNLCAAFFTREGDSLNQKAVNLHMLEDVLGWLVVLVGAVIMRFTHITVLDSLMSLGVAVYILIHALKNLKSILDLFLEKAPEGISTEEIKVHLCQIEGVLDVHHIHIRSIDGFHHSASMHVRTNADPHQIKHKVRDVLQGFGIAHATLELETETEHCHDEHHHVEHDNHHHHHHHH